MLLQERRPLAFMSNLLIFCLSSRKGSTQSSSLESIRIPLLSITNLYMRRGVTFFALILSHSYFFVIGRKGRCWATRSGRNKSNTVGIGTKSNTGYRHFFFLG